MAKKSTSRSTTSHSAVQVCAFWGLAISAILFIVGGILAFIASHTGDFGAILTQISSIFSLIASIALAVAIALPAYGYVRGRSKGWKIFYWICLIVYIFGIVLGMLPRFM